MNAQVPLLWLCGPSGVGKSAVGWEIFRQLNGGGSATAYVDADQLGLCYPAPAEDPENHRIKARNLAAVWAAFRERGAGSVILSGGIDSADLIGSYTEQLPQGALTLCRLRASHATLTDRFVRRGWMSHLAGQAVAEAEELDRLDFADLCIDTDSLSISEVAQLVRDRAGGWPAPATSRAQHDVAPAPTMASDPVPVLMLCGPPAVGKSTVGYQVFTRVNATAKAAYVDLAQIGFCRPAPVDDPDNHRLKAANLAAMWPAFRDAGAQCLVVTGRVNDAEALRAYTDALPTMTLTVCWLHASRGALTDRILSRGRGDGPSIPGDELKGQPLATLHQAAQDAGSLPPGQFADLYVGTDERSVDDVVRLVMAKTAGWAHLASRTS